MKHRLLVVDDDRANLDWLKVLLEREGYSVSVADRAAEAVLTVAEVHPHLILSDVSMPGLGGLGLCRAVKSDRETASIPLILMSGVQKAEHEQALGIEQGADDYLLKPFTPRLLLAKIRSLLKRGLGVPVKAEPLKFEGLILDPAARTAELRGQRIALTRKEFDLLDTFLRKPGRVLSADFLLETIWGYDTAEYSDPHTVETHISSLRRKLGPKIARKIVSVPGLGYRFEGARH